MNNTRIKILFLDHTPFVGGAQISLVEHLKKLNRQRFEPLIGCTEKAKELGLAERYERAGLRYVFLPIQRLKFFHPAVFSRLVKNILALRDLITKEKIKIIFANTIRTAIVSALVALTGRGKVIWYLQDYTFPRLLYKILRPIPIKILYVSQSVAEFYQKRLSAKDEVIHIWRNFYEQSSQVSEELRDKRRREWDAYDGKIVIGFIGRLVEWKGPQVLLEAMIGLAEKGITNVKAVFIGTGAGQETNNEEALKALVREKKLEDYILFTGFQSEVAVSMSALDIFCLTSIEPEPFSSVVIEAMMAKVPVIGTNIGGTPEIVKNLETGLLIEANRSADLSVAIQRLAGDEVLRKKLAERAFADVMQNNTGEGASRRLEMIYEKLA